PIPPTYTVEAHSNGDLYIKPVTSEIPKVLNCTVKQLHTAPTPKSKQGGGSDIVTAFVPCKNSSTALTILYSHGNAVDLGQMLPVYRELSKLLKVNVMGYDFTGYGACSGTPSVQQT
ncbi:hydrolase_4 domain-containing protein, partial [Haematococcus lacustris]